LSLEDQISGGAILSESHGGTSLGKLAHYYRGRMMVSDLIGMPSRPCFRLVDHLVKDVNGVLGDASLLREEKQEEGNEVHGDTSEKVDFSRNLSGVPGDHIATHTKLP
jgi:hypothetical protein